MLQWGLNRSPGCRGLDRGTPHLGNTASMGPEPKSRMQVERAVDLYERDVLQWGLNRSPGCRAVLQVVARAAKAGFNGA